MPIKNELVLIACGLLGLYMAGAYLGKHAGDIVTAIPQAVGDGVADIAIGTGAVLGIPATNMTECEKAIAEGRTWDASFACPAGTFIKSIFD